jgi:hypothetical protein
MRMCFKRFGPIALLAIVALTLAPQAFATAELRITDGINFVDIVDGGVGDANGTLGVPNNVVTFVGTIGTWTLNVTTGSSHGASAGTDLDLNSVNSTSAASTLTILFSDNGFASGGHTLSVGGTLQPAVGTPAGSTVSFSAYEAATMFAGCTALPVPAACTGQIGSTLGPFSATPYSGSTSGSGVGAALTERAVLQMTGAESTSFNAALTPVPEPASVALFGGVLLFSVTMTRRKLRKS